MRKLQILLNAGESKEIVNRYSHFLRLESIIEIEKKLKKLKEPISPKSRNKILLPLSLIPAQYVQESDTSDASHSSDGTIEEETYEGDMSRPRKETVRGSSVKNF